MAPRVSIVGAGVIGLSCAWQLSKAGFKATVYHDKPIGNSASGQGAGALKPFDANQTGSKQRLQQQSLWMMPAFLEALTQDSSVKVPYARCGRLAIYNHANSWRKTCLGADVANQNWPFEKAQTVVPTEEIKRSFPLINTLEEGTQGAIHCHVTAHLNPQKLLAALHAACQKNGVLFKQQRLKALPPARPLVVAAGAFTSALVPQVNIKPIKRQAILLAWPHKEPLEMIFENGQVYLVPWHEGRAVYVGSTYEPEAGFDDAPTAAAEHLLRQNAAVLVPGLKTAPLLKHFSGLQSRQSGGDSSLFLGPVPGQKGVFMATGHGGVGFCMAPITAQKIVAFVQGKTP